MGDDYRYRIEVDAKKKFLELLKDRFNSGVSYKGKKWKWDIVILNKAQELGRYFLTKPEFIDFTDPSPTLTRNDTLEIRKRILELTNKQTKGLGIDKSTLHYLRKHAKSEKPFRIYRKVVNRLR